MNELKAVIWFTFRHKLRTRAFLVTTMIIAIALSIIVHIPYLVKVFRSDEPIRIGLVTGADYSAAEQLSNYFNAQDSDIQMVSYQGIGNAVSDEQMVQAAMKADEIDGYLWIPPFIESSFPTPVYKSEEQLDGGKIGQLQSALQLIKNDQLASQLGLTKQQQKLLNEPVVIETEQLTPAGEAVEKKEEMSPGQRAFAVGIIYAVIIVLFMGIMISGQLIAAEITSEKSSRVMEILITSVSSLKLMFGKIFGMFFVSLAQIIIFASVTIFHLLLPYNRKLMGDWDIDYSLIPVSMLIYGLLFYLMGFFLYATLFAAVGSIVSRTEDLGQAVMPITFLSLAAFYIGIFGLNVPDSTWVKISSFIPFFTPTVMFMRIGISSPSLWEIALSIAILVVTTYFAGWISAKIYRTGVLMYGKRPSWKELRKAMKAYKF